MNEMIKLSQPYKCECCGQEMLFFFTKRNTLIDYKAIFRRFTTSNELRDYLQNKDIIKFKCVSCGKEFIIDLRRGYPIPLYDNSILQQFGCD